MKTEIKEKRAILKATKILQSVFKIVDARIGLEGDDFVRKRRTIIFKVEEK